MEVSTRQDGEKSREGGEETGIMTILPCELILYILLCVDSHQTVRISQSSVHPTQDKEMRVRKVCAGRLSGAMARGSDKRSLLLQLCSCASTSKNWHELCTVQPFRDLGERTLPLAVVVHFTWCIGSMHSTPPQPLECFPPPVFSHQRHLEISLEFTAGEADVEEFCLLPRHDGWRSISI